MNGSSEVICFLSHLCGDEDDYLGGSWIIDFLSHLCGDEVC